MREHLPTRWREILFGLGIFAVALIFYLYMRAISTESVRTELIRLQDQSGLTLAWADDKFSSMSFMNRSPMNDGFRAISFKKRAIVPLRDSPQSFRLAGFRIDAIPTVRTIDPCWSHDGSKLAATMFPPRETSLGIFDLGSQTTQMVEPHADQRMHFTSQCWSPDDKLVAYETGGSVKVYQIGSDTSSTRVLGKGTDVTWSPDGKWVAFRDRDTYYVVRPDGSGRKVLFRQSEAVSALYWSPDSRIVAYVRELGFPFGGALDAEVNQLRARRLEDGSEDWLCPNSVNWFANYQWLKSSALMKHLETESPR